MSTEEPRAVDNEVHGRLALITGASGGIGAGIAHSLAAEGCHLALTYSSSKAPCEALAQELTKTHSHLKITTHQLDVSDASAITSTVAQILSQHDRKCIDILISNAGRGVRIVNVWDIPIEEFDATINVNLRASFLLVKAVVEGMRDQKWGRIIFVGSIAAYGAGVNGCHYAASKGGILSMMKNLASRLGPYGITANDVAPAMIGETGMIPNAAAVPGVVEQIPVGRLGTTDEVGRAVAMFVKCGYITGESLLVSGGLRHL